MIQESYDDQGDNTGDDDDTEMSDGDGDEEEEDPQPQLDPRARLATKQADPVFKGLLRSKGFIWLATRPLISGEWSQAGVMLTVGGGQKWLCEKPQSEWPEHPECACSSL